MGRSWLPSDVRYRLSVTGSEETATTNGPAGLAQAFVANVGVAK
jgi:hypothetical protein